MAAHSNLGTDGKGVGKKSDDCFVSYLCAECHHNYDGKVLGKEHFADRTYTPQYLVSQGDFDRAMKRTMKIWLSELLEGK